MKTILLPIEDHNEVGAIVATAANLARAYGSRCEAIGLTHFPYPTVGAEPILAVSLAPTFEGDEDKAQRFRGRFEEARSSLPGDLADQFRWRGGDPLEEPDLAALARVFDLTVIGRPSETPDGPRMTTLETVLFDSGRPILIAPPEARDGPIGRNVVLSWNGSTEGAETVTASLPILKAAERVTVLTVDGGTVAGPDGGALRDYLGVHDIDAKHVHETGRRSRPGEAILDFAKREGADLLIKSAYTHSRLRQMVFGGATATILAEATLPVFMAN